MPRAFRPSKAELAAVPFITVGFIAALALSLDGAATPPATPVPGPEFFTGILLGTDYDPQYPERNSFGIRTDVFVIASMVTYPEEWEFPARLVLFAVPRDLWLPIACAAVELPGR